MVHSEPLIEATCRRAKRQRQRPLTGRIPGEPDQPHRHLSGMAGGSLADLNFGPLGSQELAALVEHGYSGPRRCSDALSLEYQNAEYYEDQRQQPSNAERFLQEHEPNKQDDAHLGCCDYW